MSINLSQNLNIPTRISSSYSVYKIWTKEDLLNNREPAKVLRDCSRRELVMCAGSLRYPPT